MTVKVSVRFCPMCGSARVDFSELTGGSARCLGCGWSGDASELFIVHGAAEGFSGDKLTELVNDMRQLLAGELGMPYLRFLLRWGFLQGDLNNLPGTLDRKKFARYLMAIGRAILTAILEERGRQSTEETRKEIARGDHKPS